ncbi:MAG: 16S rRNA (cytidine(1402)-2'-O)-methyltransferase [Bacilli bacterium]|jgi:16S rRNA (cytidine1402-2'-O)-methyltransferase
MKRKSYDGTPSLYLVPTPIGNLEDITFRAVRILKEADVIFCEDTRETKELLSYFKIKSKLILCNEQNEDEIKASVIAYLKEGKMVALTTDRGTPVISDPGYRVVTHVINAGYNVIGLPGPTALIPALVVSGLPPAPFLFYGFLNSRVAKRDKELEALKRVSYTLIFYEAPHRLTNTLKAMYKIFGERKITIAREISKIHEEIYYGNLTTCLDEDLTIRGELVLIVEGKKENSYEHLSIVEHINLYIKEGHSEKEAIKLVAKDRDIAKSIVYKQYHMR